MAKIVPPLVFRKQAEYDGKYDAVSECELRPHETFKLLRAHALQQLYIMPRKQWLALENETKTGVPLLSCTRCTLTSTARTCKTPITSTKREISYHAFSVSTHASPALSADRVWARPRSIDKHAMSAAESSPSTLRVWHRDTYNQSHWLS